MVGRADKLKPSIICYRSEVYETKVGLCELVIAVCLLGGNALSDRRSFLPRLEVCRSLCRMQYYAFGFSLEESLRKLRSSR